MTTGAIEVDYYALLGIDRSADDDAVLTAVKKSMREWRKRTEAPDLSVRQEAEMQVKRIEDARKTLTDPALRRAYDERLSREGVQQPAVEQGSGGDRDWLQLAIDYLGKGDYASAAYAARESTHTRGNDARTWWVRSRANAGLSRWDDALYEAQQAVLLQPDHAEFHFHLGCIAEEMRRWDQALSEFQAASSLDRSVPMYTLAVGGVYLQNGAPGRALQIIEEAFGRHPDDETTQYYLANALVDVAEHVPAKRTRDTYAVTSEAEIALMRKYAERAASLPKAGKEAHDAARNVLDYLERMEKKAFRLPVFLLGIGAIGAEMGCLGAVLGASIAIALALLPVILFLSGISAFGSDPGVGFLLVVISVPLGYGYFKMCYIPRWKANKKDL